MKPCQAHEADLLLDGNAWRCDSLRELCALGKQLQGRRGVDFVRWQKSVARLSVTASQAERAAYDRALDKGKLPA